MIIKTINKGFVEVFMVSNIASKIESRKTCNYIFMNVTYKDASHLKVVSHYLTIAALSTRLGFLGKVDA